MTVSLTKTPDASRAVERAAVERLTAPLGEDETADGWHQDAMIALGRRGARDAVFTQCAKHDTWTEALARVVLGGLVSDDPLPHHTRQNVAMLAATCAWRAGLDDYAVSVIVAEPDWQEHRGLDLMRRVIASGRSFTGWEAIMAGLPLDYCLDFQG